jgi:hypothetical protein
MVRVVAWRQHTATWPHPDLASIHAERAALLHWWAEAYGLEKAKPDQTQDAVPPPPDGRPLFALTIVNQSGGTVVVLDATAPGPVDESTARVTNPKWRGQELVV